MLVHQMGHWDITKLPCETHGFCSMHLAETLKPKNSPPTVSVLATSRCRYSSFGSCISVPFSKHEIGKKYLEQANQKFSMSPITQSSNFERFVLVILYSCWIFKEISNLQFLVGVMKTFGL